MTLLRSSSYSRLTILLPSSYYPSTHSRLAFSSPPPRYGVSLILSAGADVCKASHICLDGLGFSPSGETGERFWGGTPSVLRTSTLRGTRPPNSKVRNLGETQRWAFLCTRDKNSSFILFHVIILLVRRSKSWKH